MERGRCSLERRVGRRLRDRGWRLAVAESCTGGGLGARLTAVAGSSAYVAGGIIAYANAVKQTMLGVPRRLIERYGAVSRSVADAMAEGARKRLHTELAVAVTGVAGPGGGQPDKPVGCVWIAVAGPDGCRSRRFMFRGRRDRVRGLAVDAALLLMEQYLDDNT